MQVLEDALEPQNDIFKMVKCFVRSNTLFQIYDQNS